MCAHELLVFALSSGDILSILSFLLILIGVILNALAQLLLKLGANKLGPEPFTGRSIPDNALAVLSQWPYWLGFSFYGISLVVWIIALTKVPVTVAYPMLSIGYVLNALIARYWLGESLALSGWAGITFICIGVTLIARSHT
jgi:multidrug transporter EmrE-like cation transporter